MRSSCNTYRRLLTTLAVGALLTACGQPSTDQTISDLHALNSCSADHHRDYRTVELLAQSLTLTSASSKTITIPGGWRHIKRLTIAAEGIRNDAMFEVLVNNTVKGTIYVPGRDPSYVVTIAEGANTIELRHTQGASVKITSIKALVSSTCVHPPRDGGGSIGDAGRAQAAHLAYHGIKLSDRFHPHTSPDDWETYILPIKISAGRTYALARASGDLSGRVRQSLVSLHAQINLADPYIHRALSDDHTFDLAVELLTLRNTLEDLLD